VKRYPAEVTLASLICLAGGLQSAVVALIADHNPRAWAIGLDYTLYGPLYAVSQVIYCTRKESN